MNIIVEGVTIELTPKQIALIEKERRLREKCRGSFKKMLRKLGFIQSPGTPGSFSHKNRQWYAEIIDRGHYSDVWMIGEGLKSVAGFPGGYVYESPIELEKEVINALSDDPK